MKFSTIRHSENGFSLLEVLLAMAILASIIIGASAMLKNTVTARFALSERATTLRHAQNVLQRISNDLTHAFIIQTTDQLRNPGTRKHNGIFRIEKSSSGEELSLTTMTRKPLRANDFDSDTTFVIYRLEEDRENIGRKKLLRGESKRIPDDLKDELTMELISSHIKSIRYKCWKGDDWTDEPWDSTRNLGDGTRSKMPHMVMIEVEAFEIDTVMTPNTGDKDSAEDPSFLLKTVVTLPNAFSMPEVKSMASNIKWSPW